MKLRKMERSLIKFKTQHMEFNGVHDCPSIHTNTTGSLNNKKTIAYSKHALRTIGKQV